MVLCQVNHRELIHILISLWLSDRALSHACNKMENIFLYIFTKLKIYHPSYSIYKYDNIDIADPNHMQDSCHMNFVIDLTHRSLCGSVIEHWNTESKGLRFNSSWGLKMFSLFHACDKMKIFLYIFTELKNLPSLLFYSQTRTKKLTS